MNKKYKMNLLSIIILQKVYQKFMVQNYKHKNKRKIVKNKNNNQNNYLNNLINKVTF